MIEESPLIQNARRHLQEMLEHFREEPRKTSEEERFLDVLDKLRTKTMYDEIYYEFLQKYVNVLEGRYNV